MNYEYLQDATFLKKIDNLQIKTQFIRISSLTWNTEEITGEIQGQVINGSGSYNGDSSLRRTFNLTLFAEEKQNDFNKIDEIFSINSKIKLEIGIKNTLPIESFFIENKETKRNKRYDINYQERYGDIIWFPLGIFIVFDPNISHSTTGATISVSLKDKMCLLNGEVGGVLPAAVSFHEKEYDLDDGSTQIEKATLVQIIRECVNHFGGEDLTRIVISDLDERVKVAMRYMGDNNLYLYEDKSNDEAQQNGIELTLDYKYTEDGKSIEPTRTFTYGEDVGFIYTDFIYNGELINNPGDSITSILDKIVSALGNFEYFYDVFGNFHFQEKKNYINTTYAQMITNYEAGKISGYSQAKFFDTPNVSPPYNYDYLNTESVYSFDGTKLITALSNAPKYSNIKNDYVVWGVRKDSDGGEHVIRYHLAVDKKPELQEHILGFYTDDYDVYRATNPAQHVFEDYTSFPVVGIEGDLYYSVTDNEYYYFYNKTDKDGYATDEINYLSFQDIKKWLFKNKKIKEPDFDFKNESNNDEYYKYWEDFLKNFWTYKQENWNKRAEKAKADGDKNTEDMALAKAAVCARRAEEAISFRKVISKDYREELYYQGIEAMASATDYNYYFTELINEWPIIYDLKEQDFKPEVKANPSTINFYLDFIEDTSEYGKYCVNNIGRRSYIEERDDVNCLFENEIPDYILINTSEEESVVDALKKEAEDRDQQWIQIDSGLYAALMIGGVQNSAYVRLGELLNQYTFLNETITITCLPIYYLEPNTLITVHDETAGIYGDYFIKTISVPLDTNGTMSISAARINKKI